MRVLVVEDEKRLLDTIVYMLEQDGYIVDYSEDGILGENMILTSIYDVIILDRMLPEKEGIEILKTIRQEDINTPVIFLTAKDSIKDKVEGLDAGADDYLIKPFSKDELLARVRALSRRVPVISPDIKLSIKNLTLDIKNKTVSIDNKKIVLTKKESNLLEYLMKNLNIVLSKEQIFDKVWGFETEAYIDNVELYIFYLRKKIDFLCSGLTIETVRGIGYKLKES